MASSTILFGRFTRRYWGILRELLGSAVSEEQLHLIGFSIIGQIFYQRVGGPVINLVVGTAEHQTYDTERLADHIADFSLAAVRGFGNLSEKGSEENASPKRR